VCAYVYMFLLKMNSVYDDVGSPEVSHNIEFFGSMDTILRQMVGFSRVSRDSRVMFRVSVSVEPVRQGRRCTYLVMTQMKSNSFPGNMYL